MAELRPWVEYQSWHELLDALCAAQDHQDNAKLATDLCLLIESNGETAYEAALRNFMNWRKGQHVPHRRNFGVLTKLLKVDDYDGLKPRWNALYVEAKKNNGNGNSIDPNSNLKPMLFGLPRAVGITTAVLIFILASGVGFGFSSGFFQSVAAIIHGARSKCGHQPAPWEKILTRLPKLKTGTFSDGGMGSRYSRSCNGLTPARAVKFTATQKGHEEFSLFGDRTTIDVE
jgi:hypothetical protein